MDLKPKFLIIPNKHVESYAQTISDCITGIGLQSKIDKRYELKLAERMKDTDAYIVIAVGPKNRDTQNLQIKLDNQIQTMSFEHFIKFTIALTQ
jgi:hypothetical protein